MVTGDRNAVHCAEGISPSSSSASFALSLHGGPAPARRFLPELIELIWNRTIDPGKVFDPELPLVQAAEGYRAMNERRAIKTCCDPDQHVPRM